jgi:hypothetical protein
MYTMASHKLRASGVVSLLVSGDVCTGKRTIVSGIARTVPLSNSCSVSVGKAEESVVRVPTM